MFKISRLQSTSKNVLINTFGNYLNVFFTIVYTFVLVGRTFNRVQYGQFSILVAIASVLANILDFGVTASIFSQLPVLLEKKDTIYSFLKTNLIFQTVLSTAVLIIMFIFIKPLDAIIFKLHISSSIYLMTFLAVPLLIWQNSVLNSLYAAKLFFRANVYINLSNLIKIIVIFWLIYIHAATVASIFFTLFILSSFFFFAVILVDKPKILWRVLEAPIRRRNILVRYSFTYFLASQFFNLANRVDLFVLNFYQPIAVVGIYAPAQKIILTIISAVNSITQVLSPEFAAAKTRPQVISLIKKGLTYMLLPVGLFVGVILTPTYFFELFFTRDFSATAPIARVLSASYILFAVSSVPVLFFLYTIRDATQLLIINGGLLVMVFAGCLFFVPRLGPFGPAVAYLMAFLVVTIYTTWKVREELTGLSNG